jgi:hypothetical protein
MVAVPSFGRAGGLVVGVDGVPPAGGADCSHGSPSSFWLIVSARLLGARPLPAPLSAQRTGPPSEEAKPATRAEVPRRRRSRLAAWRRPGAPA